MVLEKDKGLIPGSAFLPKPFTCQRIHRRGKFTCLFYATACLTLRVRTYSRPWEAVYQRARGSIS